jgi:molybdate transport system regulatory protein
MALSLTNVRLTLVVSATANPLSHRRVLDAKLRLLHDAGACPVSGARGSFGGIGVQPRVKLWLEKDGLLVFSDYRAELLDHIARTGSISGGAERMGLSYRRAWGKIKEIEHNLGVRLVQSEAGGPGGGRTRLTAEAEELLAHYRAFRAAAQSDLKRDFAEAFDRGG